MIADAQKVFRASEKHWQEMKRFGAKETELRDFSRTIDDAGKASVVVLHDPGSLEEIRNELKDCLGDYRTSAEILCNGFNRRDEKLERDLRVGNAFPGNDLKLRAYVDGLETIVKKHSARLADRGFGKAEQQQLFSAISRFTAALAKRGKERGAARAERMTRDAALEKLRAQTSYFRRIGRAALKTDADRADFDRVARAGKAKKAPAPAPAGSMKQA